MKKMLVIFLILISRVLADSEENNYVDLLPDEEKQHFLDKVASRIMEDVESTENVTKAANVEIPDKVLNQHSEYVKKVFKEEQANFRKSRGNIKEKITSSDENDNLDVKPLKIKRSEPVDLNEQDTDTSNKTTINNVTIENVSDNATVSNVTVQNDNDKKSSESEEATSEALQKVSETNNKKDKSNEEEAITEKNKKVNVTIEAKALSTNDSKENTNEKKSKETEPSDNSNENEEIEKSNSGSSEARNVSVKSLNEQRLRRFAGNITDGNSTTSTVENIGVTSAENNSVSYNNGSGAAEEVTNTTNALESNSTKVSSPKSISSESSSSESKSIENTTDSPSSESTTTNKDDEEPSTKSRNDTLENVSQTTTESPQSSTVTVKQTTDFLPKTVTEPDTVEEEPETSTVPTTSKHTTVSIPVDTTKETKIIVEDFTSMPTSDTTIKPKTGKTKIKKSKMKTTLPQEVTTEASQSDEETIEATTKKRLDTLKVSKTKKVKHKAVIYKLPKVIVGPKAKKIAEAEIEEQNKNFIELKQVYFDNNYKVNVGKEYHVYEIPDGGTPFIKDEDPVAEQPYYVPVYNYSPNNAYFNPQNRLGPNAEDSGENMRMIDNDDDMNFDDDDDEDFNQQIERTETIDVEMQYGKSFDRQRKKFGSKQSASQGIHRQPLPNNGDHNTRGKVNPEDYLDSDYYFGRIRNNLARRTRKNDLDNVPYPGGNIPGGTLKDHVRAVRNILYQHKTFGILQNDARNIDRRVRISKDDIDLFKEVDDENSNKHFQKVGYLKGENDTKELYVMDDFFKENVEKYIQEQTLTPATSLPNLVTTVKNSEESGEDSGDTGSNNNNTSDSSVNSNLRRNGVVKVSVYLQVLNDMVTLDNKALIQYDWLGTTVDIQAALQKLIELIALITNNEDIHPADMEIIKYLLFLHKLSSQIIEADDFSAQLRKKLALPRNKKKKIKPRILKEKGLLNRVWLYLRKEVPQGDGDEALKHLNEFLMHVEDGLFDLHEAIKNIAKITKYNNQHWYQNLKDLYISLDEKHLLELLLHITALRLFALIEESAKNGLEDNYIEYMKENRDHCKKTMEEIMFIMKILDEYKRFVE